MQDNSFHIFHDRTDAGLQLAARLEKYARRMDTVVLAIPRGGVPVGFAVAQSLHLPLDVVLAKKIGHPTNKEYAIGAASLTDYFVVPHEEAGDDYIREELEHVRTRLREMQEKFCEGRPPLTLEGKTVIVVDDGIATGRTLLATVRLIRKNNPANIVIAVPVASDSAAELFRQEVDEFICLLVPPYFGSVGAFYENFGQVSDEEVISLLEKMRRPPAP